MAKAQKHAHGSSKEHGPLSLANCACESAPGGRKAFGVDAGLKEANQNRLRRIEGQIRGLQKAARKKRLRRCTTNCSN